MRNAPAGIFYNGKMMERIWDNAQHTSSAASSYFGQGPLLSPGTSCVGKRISRLTYAASAS